MSDNPNDLLSGALTPEQLEASVNTFASGAVGAAASTAVLKSLDCPPPERVVPGEKSLVSFASADAAYAGIQQAAINMGLPCWLATIIAGVLGAFVGAIGIIVGAILYAFEILSKSLLPVGLQMIDTFRENLDPEVARVAVMVLNEILGTEYSGEHLPTGHDFADHLARAKQIGALFHEQMLENFTDREASTQTVGRLGAERFTGQIVNFGVATALLGLAGEIGSVGLFKDFRLIGEQVTSGLGLGRMNRLAMRPLIQTCVAQPYQWWLNKKFHPTQFKAAEIANPFTQTLLDKDQVYKALDLEGWSDDKKQALIELHQKRLSTDDVEILKRWGYWDEAATHKYLVKLGWPEELADTAGRIPELKRIDARITKLIDKLESAVDAGHMTADDALALIKTLPVTEDERAVIQATMMTFVKVPHKSLTLTEIEKAFENGLITVDDVIARLQQAGFQGDDLSVLVELVLLKFAHDQEAKAAAQTRHDQQVSKAKAKGTAVPKKPAILA
jgi:hypothetical protein